MYLIKRNNQVTLGEDVSRVIKELNKVLGTRLLFFDYRPDIDWKNEWVGRVTLKHKVTGKVYNSDVEINQYHFVFHNINPPRPEEWLWKDHRIPQDLTLIANGHDIPGTYVGVFAHQRLPNMEDQVRYYERLY